MAARREERTARGKAPVARAVRENLAQMARQDVPLLMAEVRAGARERARAILEDALVEELLSAVGHSDRAPADDASHSAWWAYGVVGAEVAQEVAGGLMGVEPGAALEAVAEGGLAMLVSRIPLAEYGDDALREHLEDITWLERTARAHEAVQQAVLGRETLVPVRLCTIYRDLDRVRQALRKNAEAFARNLTALADATEWGVKVFLDPRTVPVASGSDDAGSAGESGTAYLAGRQRERDRAAETDELCQLCAEEVQRAVGALSVEARMNPVQSPEAHGRDAEMIVNGAYLVKDERAAQLRATISALQERWTQRGLLIELTGPWPPYNFVSESAGVFS